MVNINEMREEIYRKIELLDHTKLKLALNRVDILKEIQDIEEENNIQN
ncbi:Uncharacterised protein [Clostridioides difficile]|nr:hypothetical protein [Clostridioides difficile]VHX61461.1 Uncharacterised protein [Clostridioides difficile]HBE8430552.1 hypothetical protein [Clostridioides difficile]HBF4024489.1 hypothetical protein [Clostridioides difficile]HBF6678858.1 hypothetical protein [Clostridioides difficile]HBF9903900.1 hypothetical protein [Clostridioides difficile]